MWSSLFTRGSRDRTGGVGGRPPSLVLYTDSVQVGGAEISLATLLAERSPRFSATVMGVDERVVARIVRDAQGVATCLVLPIRSKRDLGRFGAHVRALWRLRPQVFQANLITPWHCRYGVLAALLTPGTRIVAVEHCPRPTTARVQLWFKRLYSRFLAAHVAVGERSARDLERLAHLPPRSVRTIHNGVVDRPLRAVSRPATGPIVGSLGRLDEYKRFDVLVSLLPSLPSVTALLVGDGAARAALEQLAMKLGVRDRLIVTGWREDARDYLTAMDVFVLPSQFEGLPLAIVEAMLASLPVVATDVGSVREAVVDGVTGVLVAPDDVDEFASAIRSLLEDPDRRRALGSRARALALERFSPAKMARAYEQVWLSALE